MSFVRPRLDPFASTHRVGRILRSFTVCGRRIQATWERVDTMLATPCLKCLRISARWALLALPILVACGGAPSTSQELADAGHAPDAPTAHDEGEVTPEAGLIERPPTRADAGAQTISLPDAAAPLDAEPIDAGSSSDASPDVATICTPTPPPDDMTIPCELASDGCGGWYPYTNTTTNRYIQLSPGDATHFIAAPSPPSGCTLPAGCAFVSGDTYVCPGHIAR